MADYPTVLLTRPEGENEGLVSLLETASFPVRVHPMVLLQPLDVTPAMRKVAQDLDQIDKLLFVSKSAVRFTLPLLESFWPQWPIATKWYAVGQGTAAELAEYEIRAEFPEQAGSEGLLALPSLQNIADENVVIVRGHGGRALLGDEMERRGANVSFFETYERKPIVDQRLAALPDSSIVVVTSGEILEAVQENLGDRLKNNLIVTASERIAEMARQMGVRQVLNAGGASDQALYDAIVKLADSLK